MKTLGIDLGTTNTVAAIDGQVIELPDDDQETTTLPSIVAYPPTDVTLVGTAARRRRAIDPKNTIFSAKRLIGRPFRSHQVKEFSDHYPLDLVESKEGLVNFKTRNGLVSPVDAAAEILAFIKEDIELDPHQFSTVVTVPAKFDEQQRMATREAAEQAGLGQVTILEEPTATLYANLRISNENLGLVAIYDLGGGTFDMAVVDCSDLPFKVLSYGGDTYLGGDDIDQALANWAAKEVLKNHGWNLRSDMEVFDRLTTECERAKIRLCYNQKTTIELGQVDPAAPVGVEEVKLDQVMLSQLSSDLVHRTFSTCDEVMQQAKVKTSDLSTIFLAGGATHLPMVQNGVRQYFGLEPISHYDPMEVVAIGASFSG